MPNFVASTTRSRRSAEHLADQRLGRAGAAVDVGGVEVGDAGVERGVDHRPGPGAVEPAAEVVAAQAHGGHREAGPSEWVLPHRSSMANARVLGRWGAPTAAAAAVRCSPPPRGPAPCAGCSPSSGAAGGASRPGRSSRSWRCSRWPPGRSRSCGCATRPTTRRARSRSASPTPGRAASSSGAWRMTTARTRAAAAARRLQAELRPVGAGDDDRARRGGHGRASRATAASPVPVVVHTRVFDDLRGTITFPVERTRRDGARGVDARPAAPGPAARRARAPPRAAPAAARVGARRGRAAAEPRPAARRRSPTGWRSATTRRLGGRPGAELRYGRRVISKVDMVRGRSVRTTIRPSLQTAATAALGDRLGGVAAIRPRNGEVLAMAGLGGVRPAAAGLGVQDRHARRLARGRRDRAGRDVPRPDGRDARRRQAAQRRRRGVRRLAHAVVRPLLQLRLRPARREAGRAPAGPRRRARSASTRSCRSRASSRARSRTSSPTTSRSGRARSGRTATWRRR